MIEPTLTQNNALYFVQHKVERPRHSFFQRLGIPVRKSDQNDSEPQLRETLFHWPRIRWSKKR